MSGPPVVSLAGVSKQFTIYRRRAHGLKDRVIAAVGGHGDEAEQLWALKDISLDIARGETLAIVGPNGGGKSTLLQIVAGILRPDAGRVAVHGRVTSLLELGAGFSADLSGRENVFLNAALYGVPEPVVADRFDAIVAFAGLDRFIDTPVRNYSSGMYMRLGFSVAVHLDPEILLVDEAFAVGDEAFQRQCLAKIREFQERGITIVVVSHDLLLLERLATRACLIVGGTLLAAGRPSDVIGTYHQVAAGLSIDAERRWGSGDVRITDVDLLVDGRPASVTRTREPLTIRLHYAAATPVERPVFGIAVYRDDGTLVTGPNTRMSGLTIERVEGAGIADYHIPHLPLLPGRYLVSASVYDDRLVNAYDHRDRFKPFVVAEGGTDERFGVVEFVATWTFARAAGPLDTRA